MALTGTTFRGELMQVGSVLPKEFDEWSSVDAGWKTLEHDEEGAHTDITANTVEANSFKVFGQMQNMGEWFSPGYRVDYFTADGGGTWTVARADVSVFKYTIIGKTMILQFTLLNTTVAGGPTALEIQVPGNIVAVDSANNAVRADNNGVSEAAVAVINANESFVSIYLNNGYPTTAWSNATDTTNVYGQITFEIKAV